MINYSKSRSAIKAAFLLKYGVILTVTLEKDNIKQGGYADFSFAEDLPYSSLIVLIILGCAVAALSQRGILRFAFQRNQEPIVPAPPPQQPIFGGANQQ